MAISTRTISILGSLFLSLVLIVGAYVLSSPNGIRIVDAASSDEIFKSYTEKDTDGDGLKDWQEVVYGTDPENAQSVQAGMSDSEALENGLIKPRFESNTEEATLSNDVPGINALPNTLTDKFARSLLGNYLLERGGTPPSAEEMQAFVESAVKEVTEDTVSRAYNAQDVSIRGRGPEAKASYEEAVWRVFLNNPIDAKKDTLDHFSDMVTKDDTASAAEVKKHAQAYTSIGKGLIALTVPEEIASSHLRLANAFARMGSVVQDLASFPTDPIRSLIATKLYLPSQKELGLSMKEIAVIFNQE